MDKLHELQNELDESILDYNYPKAGEVTVKMMIHEATMELHKLNKDLIIDMAEKDQLIKEISEENQGLRKVIEKRRYEMRIKDSGKRRDFETGAVRDMEEGKGRYDLIPWDAIHELALHCEQGAIKYGERNCEKGIPIHSLIDSAIRHLSCYMRGMEDEPHLRAAMWNISFAIWTEKNKPEMQDIPNRGGK